MTAASLQSRPQSGRSVLLTPADPFGHKLTWVVYDHPVDLPEFYVARAWIIKGTGMIATETKIVDTDIESIRDQLRAKGLSRFKEMGGVVIEWWM